MLGAFIGSSSGKLTPFQIGYSGVNAGILLRFAAFWAGDLDV